MLKHTAVIPIAGVNITNDIRLGLGVLRSQAEQMKVQFGMALAEEAKSNAFITIPGLKGQQPKEISAKNLANIIQCRMEEILEYVMYHLKQLNLHDKLHGGIILTGGGSQLKHLIQLTEYRTGLPTRIGLPNEHLASGYASELMKPMYATCIGLILRGYDDYESNRLRFISGNSDDSEGNSEASEGTFVNMAQTYELSPEELLKQEFGDSTSMQQAPSEPQAFTPEVQEPQAQASMDLFSQPPAAPQEPRASMSEKIEKRTKLVSNVFSTVKNKVIYWFENVEDEQFDK
jgi:cell division protein FtsA